MSFTAQPTGIQTGGQAWYCARTKPKHEHIAAADLRRNAGLEVFHPRLSVERVTRRGLARLTEPLFPCYLFVRCDLDANRERIRHANGVATLVNFAGHIPSIPDGVIAELQACFGPGEPLAVAETLPAGTEVVLTEGAFLGLHASVLQALPARERVRVLLDILGRPTAVEVDRSILARERSSIADLAPTLRLAGAQVG